MGLTVTQLENELTLINAQITERLQQGANVESFSVGSKSASLTPYSELVKQRDKLLAQIKRAKNPGGGGIGYKRVINGC